jgi:hypothetical protein
MIRPALGTLSQPGVHSRQHRLRVGAPLLVLDDGGEDEVL